MALKAKLGKAKEAARVAKAAAKASEQKFYELGVQTTKACLNEELAEVCKDYCQEVWTEVLILAGVPAALEWRRAKNVYYPSDLRKAPAAPLGFEAGAAAATTTLEQLPSTQASLLHHKTSEGPSMGGDQNHRVEGAKGKEVEALPKANDLEAKLGKEAALKKKESEPAKPQAVAQEKKASSSKTIDPLISQSASKKEDPPPTKA